MLFKLEKKSWDSAAPLASCHGTHKVKVKVSLFVT